MRPLITSRGWILLFYVGAFCAGVLNLPVDAAKGASNQSALDAASAVFLLWMARDLHRETNP